jgi:hypothetical protein
MKDVRGQSKAERAFDRRDGLQVCTVCGRYFTRARKESICSIACAEKARADSEKPAGESKSVNRS